MSLRIAYKLSPQVLYPTAIQRTNVSIAEAAFDESTIAGVTFYGYNCSTATFMKIISDLWTIWNVKSPFKYIHKRLHLARPIYSVSELSQLKNYLSYFEHWRGLSSSYAAVGLTKETYNAIITTLMSMIGLCESLLHDFRFQYVLLGKLQNDPIERRFGCYRQAHGGNYYVSLRQILSSEYKVRVSSILKSSNVPLSQLMKTLQGETFRDTNLDQSKILQWAEQVDFNGSLSNEENNIICYVAAALCRSLKFTCHLCRECFLTNDIFQIEDIENQDLIMQRDRGGLYYPSQMSIFFVSYSYKVFHSLKSKCKDPDLFESQFLQQVTVQCLRHSCDIGKLEEIQCNDGHSHTTMIKLLLRKCHFVLLKNFAKAVGASATDPAQRKVAKF